jgi:hypothetical protein
VKVAVAPESVPRLGARAALEIALIFVEVHHWLTTESPFRQAQLPKSVNDWLLYTGNLGGARSCARDAGDENLRAT